MFNIVSEDNSNPREHAIGVAPTALISGLLLLAVVCAPVALAKGKPDPGGPGFKLNIEEVFLSDPFDIDDDEPSELEIFGESLDYGDGPLEVTLGTFPPLVCSTQTPEYIKCDLPAGGVGVAGDYELVVSNGVGQTEADEYDLTIAEPPVPEGTIAFYAATACPPGWDEYTAAQGLAIVGLPSGGSVAGGFGTPMGNNEDRTGHTHDVDPAAVDSSTDGAHDHTGSTSPGGAHTHSMSGAQDSETADAVTDVVAIVNNSSLVSGINHTHNIFEASNHQHNVAQDGDHNHSVDVGNTTSTTPSKEDVLPYIQLLACVKGCISDCDAE